MNKKIKLMSHLVAGYPTDDLAFTAPKTKFEHDIKLAPIWVRKTIAEL